MNKKLKMSYIYKQTITTHMGLRRCPHLLNLTTKLGKTQQKKKKQARSTHVLVYPRLEEEGRPYHFPSYTSSEI
jgi:hypothetical protein